MGHQSPVPTPDFPIYRQGARVAHLDHGRGTVVETNTTTTVYVEFDSDSGGRTYGMHWHDVTKIGVPQPDFPAQ